LGRTEIKGIGEPINVYEVIGPGPLRDHFELAARRGLSRFVGRERELAELQRALELALNGHGQIIAVVAEAGTGKSRLFYEFKAKLPAGCKVLEAYSVSHGKATAWLPVLELLCGYFGILDGDEPPTRRAKVRAAVGALEQNPSPNVTAHAQKAQEPSRSPLSHDEARQGSALRGVLPYLFALLGIQDDPDPLTQMDPQIKQRRTLDAIKRVLVSESLRQPTIVILEDLHWIDSQTQALLDLLADSILNSRVLLLLNYRPEYRHEWGNKSHYSQIRLDALGRAGTEEMLSALLGDGAELAPLKRLVIERTEGNPFFIEEMVQALFDDGTLVRNGAVKLSRSPSELRLPPTVQGLLASRIDRLPSDYKQLLQTLAVIGRESSLGLIRQVVSLAPLETEQVLLNLQAGEFIFERPSLSEVRYVFKHALVQDAAYHSLLKGKRQQLHQQIAQVLEERFPDIKASRPDLLAHHYTEAGRIAEALPYWRQAGLEAVARAAHREAVGLFSKGLELLQALPVSEQHAQDELTLQIALGSALMITKGYAVAEAARAYTRARELCGQLGEPPNLLPTLFGLHGFYELRGERGPAHEIAEQIVTLASGREDPTMLLIAHRVQGVSSYIEGDLAIARRHLEQALILYDPARHPAMAFRYSGYDPSVHCLGYLAVTLWYLGFPDQAMQRIEQGLSRAQELAHPPSLAYALMMAAAVHAFRRELTAAQARAQAAIALSVAQGWPHFEAESRVCLGRVLAAQGGIEEGIAEIERGRATYRATGAVIAHLRHMAALASAYACAGQAQDGLRIVAEALEMESLTWQHLAEAELYLLKGIILMEVGRQARDDVSAETLKPEAEECFLKAIEIVQHHSAKSLELRSVTELSRLWQQRGQQARARRRLAEIYGWFTEGFDTADLKDAKRLLDELDTN